MVHIHHEGAIGVPLDFAFDYIADLRNAGEWLFGVAKLEVEGDVTLGLGTTYDGAIKLGPKTLHSTVRVVRWEPPHVVGTVSELGFVNRSTWTLSSAGEEATDVVADIELELPEGVAGRVLGGLIEPFIAIAVRHSDDALRELLEKRYREAGAEPR